MLWLQRILLRGQVLNVACCSELETGVRFDDPIFHPREQIGRKLLQPREDILRELPVVRPLLDDGEGDRRIHPQPHFLELLGHQFAEDFPDAHARIKIAAPPDARPPAAVITVLGMIQRLLHEPLERHRPMVADLTPHVGEQIGVAGAGFHKRFLTTRI